MRIGLLKFTWIEKLVIAEIVGLVNQVSGSIKVLHLTYRPVTCVMFIVGVQISALFLELIFIYLIIFDLIHFKIV